MTAVLTQKELPEEDRSGRDQAMRQSFAKQTSQRISMIQSHLVGKHGPGRRKLDYKMFTGSTDLGIRAPRLPLDLYFSSLGNESLT